MAKPLALTSGEPAGIGPDIAIAAWLRRSEANLPPFYLLGDRAFFADRARHIGLNADFAEVDVDEAVTAFSKALPVVATGKQATAAPGRPDGSSADAVIASIRQAVGDVTAGRASAVVTNPIAKSVLYRAGFKHPGHTEFLAELASRDGKTPQPVMMLWSPTLAVVPVTIHLPLRDAIAQLTSELIVETARIAVEAPNELTDRSIVVVDRELFRLLGAGSKYCDRERLLVRVDAHPSDRSFHDRLLRMRLWRESANPRLGRIASAHAWRLTAATTSRSSRSLHTYYEIRPIRRNSSRIASSVEGTSRPSALIVPMPVMATRRMPLA